LGSAAGRSYVVFGSAKGYAGVQSIDHIGGQGNDTLTGSSAAESFAGGTGNDILTGNGGADVMMGGAGNDVLVIDASLVTALQNTLGAGGNATQLATLDGGTGVDSIRLSSGAGLDLTLVSNLAASNADANSRISSIERIDMATDGAANALKLALQDVLDMTGKNVFNTGNGWTNTSGSALSDTVARHQLLVEGSTGDLLNLSGGACWSLAGTVKGSISGTEQTYNVWNHGTSLAQLLVDSDLTLNAVI
jgi:Ca2+-binding RTX toxin-like protein